MTSPKNAGPKQASNNAHYIPYHQALRILNERLKATPVEVAAWVWMGPELGGVAAYRHSDKRDGWTRFTFDYPDGDNYIARLGACWFVPDEVARFAPCDRYITGAVLIERWAELGAAVDEFIRDSIFQSRLTDLHPKSARSTMHSAEQK